MSDMFKGCSSLPSIFQYSKINELKSLSSLFVGISKIIIKTITGKTISVSYLNDDTIQNIKNKINTNLGIPPELQLLFLNGNQLEDNKTLKDYNIQNNTILHLVLKKK